MKILETDRNSTEQILAALRPAFTGPDTEVAKIVTEIIADVRKRGDEALLELGRKFDSPELKDLKASEEEFEQAYSDIEPELLDAIRTAKSNIDQYHRKQLQNSWIDNKEDFLYGQLVRPLDSVGFYAPAWLAPLPSTVLMTAVPANIAGVKTVVMCSPVQKDGKIHGAMLVAARECGVTQVFKVGGAQAAAAMAYGTDTVTRVDKIVGPGSAFVTEAKRQLFGIVGIDSLAGPSDILVLADDTADPAFVAADLISQAEHGEDSPAVLVTDSRKLADAVLKEIKAQTQTAARREYIQKSLDAFGAVIIADDLDECIELTNTFAAEHLEIILAEPWAALNKIRHAGTILIGPYSPVPIGDYAAGTNHTLPTAATSRFTSGLSVDDFIKKSGLLAYSRKALEKLAPTVYELADAEGLEAHANTVRIRLEKSDK